MAQELNDPSFTGFVNDTRRPVVSKVGNTLAGLGGTALQVGVQKARTSEAEALAGDIFGEFEAGQQKLAGMERQLSVIQGNSVMTEEGRDRGAQEMFEKIKRARMGQEQGVLSASAAKSRLAAESRALQNKYPTHATAIRETFEREFSGGDRFAAAQAQEDFQLKLLQQQELSIDTALNDMGFPPHVRGNPQVRALVWEVAQENFQRTQTKAADEAAITRYNRMKAETEAPYVAGNAARAAESSRLGVIAKRLDVANKQAALTEAQNVAVTRAGTAAAKSVFAGTIRDLSMGIDAKIAALSMAPAPLLNAGQSGFLSVEQQQDLRLHADTLYARAREQAQQAMGVDPELTREFLSDATAERDRAYAVIDGKSAKNAFQEVADQETTVEVARMLNNNPVLKRVWQLSGGKGNAGQFIAVASQVLTTDPTSPAGQLMGSLFDGTGLTGDQQKTVVDRIAVEGAKGNIEDPELMPEALNNPTANPMPVLLQLPQSKVQEYQGDVETRLSTEVGQVMAAYSEFLTTPGNRIIYDPISRTVAAVSDEFGVLGDKRAKPWGRGRTEQAVNTAAQGSFLEQLYEQYPGPVFDPTNRNKRREKAPRFDEEQLTRLMYVFTMKRRNPILSDEFSPEKVLERLNPVPEESDE